MAFPQYKKKGWWIFSEQVKSGWEDRGAVSDKPVIGKGGKGYREWVACGQCNHRAHIAKEDGETFTFCPICLVKLDEK